MGGRGTVRRQSHRVLGEVRKWMSKGTPKYRRGTLGGQAAGIVGETPTRPSASSPL